MTRTAALVTGQIIPLMREPSSGSSPSRMGGYLLISILNIAAIVPSAAIRRSCEIFPRVCHSAAEAINPDTGIRVEHDLDDLRVVERITDYAAEFASEFFRVSVKYFVVYTLLLN